MVSEKDEAVEDNSRVLGDVILARFPRRHAFLAKAR